jgi:hypothetical protein
MLYVTCGWFEGSRASRRTPRGIPYTEALQLIMLTKPVAGLVRATEEGCRRNGVRKLLIG